MNCDNYHVTLHHYYNKYNNLYTAVYKMETKNIVGCSVAGLLAEKYNISRQGVHKIISNKNKSITINGAKMLKDLEDIKEILERTTTITV